MIANLYLHKDAFEYNGTDAQEQVKDKLRAFADDMRDIVYGHSDENVFCVSSEVLTCEVFTGVTLINSISSYLDGDQVAIMFSVLANQSEEYSHSLEELKSMAKYRPEEDSVTSIVYLNKSRSEMDLTHFIQFDDYEIVYDKSSWITLRRQILGNHPGNPTSFVLECEKYFTDLAIHSHCVESLQDDNYQYLDIIPRKIVYYLSCLNDGFKTIKERHRDQAPDANSILSDFSGCYGLDEPGSIERDPGKKGSLTYVFKRTKCDPDESPDVSMLCEPHLKISQPDPNREGGIDYKTFHPRIYFHFGDEKVEGGKILVGSIGAHIS